MRLIAPAFFVFSILSVFALGYFPILRTSPIGEEVSRTSSVRRAEKTAVAQAAASDLAAPPQQRKEKPGYVRLPFPDYRELVGSHQLAVPSPSSVSVEPKVTASGEFGGLPSAPSGAVLVEFGKGFVDTVKR